ncbi:hypothetical protein CRYUN_Cryun02cG0052800 [Craigia yunnanensis]
MSTAILRPEDCLRNRFRHETLSLDHPLRSRRNPNPKTVKPEANNDFSNSRRRKRSLLGLPSNNTRQTESMAAKLPGKNLVMGQVKILKRGETLIDAAEKTDRLTIHGSGGEEEFDLASASTNRSDPDPETIKKQIKLKEFKIGGFYAGSSFFVSPPPSSLPVPDFLGRTATASP